MTPLPYRVVARRRENADTVTLLLEPCGAAIPEPLPGRFTMLYAFGVGESPISVSRCGTAMEQTIRDVGAVTHALCGAEPGTVVGVRGPYGVGWGVEDAVGRDLVFAAGGIGLAPLRAALLYALERRDSYGRITLLIGARTPRDLLYAGEFAGWRARGVDVEVTVDRADAGWYGHVGLITSLLGHVPVTADPPAGEAAGAGGTPGDRPSTAAASGARTPAATAFVCGPEIMMRLTAQALAERGMTDVRVSLERNMRCGIGWCGHCQLGPLLICRDGPVVPYQAAAPLMSVKEL